jgi:hypothetical protein
VGVRKASGEGQQQQEAMSIFDAYDSEFSALSQDISKNISEYRTYSSNPGQLFTLFFLDISV